jgi:tetratricopeptide (TPR) repeat protein
MQVSSLIVFRLIVFSALCASGQTSGPWEGFSRLADERQMTDDFQGAETLRRVALRLAEKELGSADKQLVPLLAKLAIVLHFEGRDAEADPLARRGVFIAQESNDVFLTGVALNTLGVVLAGEGERARAEPVLRRSVALLAQAEGEDSLEAAKAANNLASVYADTHQYDKAEQEMKRILPVYEKHFGADHPEIALVSGNMFTVLEEQNRAAEGEPYLRRAIAIAEKAFPNGLKMANLQHCLAVLDADRENFQEAARLLEKVIATEERLLGPDHPQLGHTLEDYSLVLRRLHQKNQAKNVQNRANLILKSALADVK